jgi:hypothetical protein
MSAETHKCIISVRAGLNGSEFPTRGYRFRMRQRCPQCTDLDAKQDFAFTSARGDCATGTRRFLTLNCLQTSYHLKRDGPRIQPITASSAMQSHSTQLLSRYHTANPCDLILCSTVWGIGGGETILREKENKEEEYSEVPIKPQGVAKGAGGQAYVGVASLEARAELLKECGASLGPGLARGVRNGGGKGVREVGGRGTPAACAHAACHHCGQVRCLFGAYHTHLP